MGCPVIFGGLKPNKPPVLPGETKTLVYEKILRDAFLFHDVPEVNIRNHGYQPPSLLDMIIEYGI